MSAPAPRFPVPQLLFAVTVGIFVWSVLQSAPPLPDRVATHFDAQGEANGWMSREGHVKFLIGTGLGLSAFVVALFHSFRFFPPQVLNVPDAKFWRDPRNYPEACRIFARWSWLLAAMHLIFLGTLHSVILAANQLSPPRLTAGAMIWPTGIFLTGLVVLIWGLFQSLRRAKAALGSTS